MKKRVKILGAGISGLTAAINLAKAGYKVKVFERNKDIGMRFHGDIQGLENWSEDRDVLVHMKDMNLEVNFDHDILDYIKISNNKKLWTLDFIKPACYLVKRGNMKGSLDQGLKKQALRLGVKVYFNKSIPSKDVDIIATGPNMKKLFGMDKGIVFKTKHKDLFMGLLNKKDAYQGYSYLLITKGYACLATCIGGEFKKIDKYFQKSEEVFERLTRIKIKNPKTVGGVGSFF